MDSASAPAPAPVMETSQEFSPATAASFPTAASSFPAPLIASHEPSSLEQPTATREELQYLGNQIPEAVSVKEESEEEEEIIETTSYRYLVIILFAVFGFMNQLQYVAFATIIRETQEYFDVNALMVNVLSLLIPIVYVIGVVPGCYVYNKVGLRWGMIIGAGTNAFASLLKFISVWAPKYPLLVVAQIFVAAGQILYLSLPTLIAGIWFPPSERTVATAVASLMGFAGMAVGMFYSPYVVSLPDENTRAEWGGLMGSQFGLSTLIFILIFIFARDKPKYRPSQTSTEDYKLPLAKFLKTQMKDWNFLLLAVSFGLIVGFLTALAGLLVQILEPFEVEEEISGILAFSGILGGAANCGVVGFFVDRTHRYKYTAIALATIATVLFLIVVVVVKTVEDTDSLAIALYILVPLLEFVVLPIVPVVMELAVELAYPCPETVPSTLVLASMCLFSFIGMIVFSIILGDVPTQDTAFYCLLITLIVSAISIVGLVFVKEKLRRHAEDDAYDGQDRTGEEGGDEDAEDDSKKEYRDVQTGIATSPVTAME